MHPRLHDQLYPRRTAAENMTLIGRDTIAVDGALMGQLERFGHPVRAMGYGLGNCQAVVVREDGTAVAVSDARKDGAPSAVEEGK